MEMIVQSIAKEIKVVEFHSSHPKFLRCGNNFTADFSAVNRPGFLKHDSPLHDSPVVIRLRGYHSSANFVNMRIFSTKFKVKTSAAFI